MNKLVEIFLWLISIWFLLSNTNGYLIGVGIFDITGPVTDINMMGYAKLSQTDDGIHLRLFSRAFVIQDNRDSQPIVIVILDAGMVSQIVKTQVVKLLQSQYEPNLFTHQNVLISATHTHSGPAGYFQYLLYSISSLGFVKQTFQSLTEGIVQSINQAYKNMVEGRIFIAEGELLNASINRSPAAYFMNPVEERNKYKYDTDKTMTLLKFTTLDNQPIGMINWFAVHPVSMNNSNYLVSSDNKGYASLLFEQKMNGNKLLGKGPFVGAFAQSNEGDVSPNLAGPKCIDTGLPCDFIHSTCNNRATNCIAFGPGKNMFESTQIIGQRQFDKAWMLFQSASEELSGRIGFVHQFVNMTNISISYNNYSGTTCPPAMGYSFAAGTVDGPGDFDFIQGNSGMKHETSFWNIVRDFIKKPSEFLRKCHAPKPVLLATGELNKPYLWQPEIVETQIFALGNLLIIAVPGEFTTMSGRRVKEGVEEIANNFFKSDLQSKTQYRAVIAGLSNVYTSYIATPEEYELQRYEAASTIYGQLTLPAYVEQYKKLTQVLITGDKLQPGPTPPFFLDKLISLVPKVLFDLPLHGKSFGDVIQEPLKIYQGKDSIVEVKFVSSSPRNNIRLNDTFLNVEKYDEDNQIWSVKFTDANWETTFEWKRNGFLHRLLGNSIAIIRWTVTSVHGQCESGSYRINHFGTAKSLFGGLTNYSGTTRAFEVQC